MLDADLTELIRGSVDELTAGARAPAGLVSRVLQRDRRRRAAFRAGGIAAVGAVAAAAAVIATLTAAAPGSAPGGAATADYVVHRTERALAASSTRDFIEARIATTFRPGTAIPGTVAVRSTESPTAGGSAPTGWPAAAARCTPNGSGTRQVTRP